jgi:peptidoglycan/LPS O-acetylase OafA/YrhL
MDYRREIDGLRALAVLPVILYHAGFETLSGGFVGVDVFFVISGYLITTIILAELEQGKFSIVNFYERRARRILPALFLVMLVCIPAAWFWLLPSDMKNFSQSLVSVPFFVSNILFWHQSGYFDASAELKPLLHTWSLAVEEQYYVICPLFLMLFWRLGKRWILVALGLVFVASLALAQWAAYAKPAAAFFLLPTRGWELLIGAFAAFYLSKANRKEFGKAAGEFGGWLGVALILYAVFAFSKATPFPGFYALVPALGTVLIILFATQQTTVGKFVGNKAFVGVGLISYSAYLWHQPLFAFARQNGFSHLDSGVFLFLSVFSLILAFFSWKLIEAPFRNKRFVGRKSIFLFALVGSFFFVSLGFYGHKKNGDVGQLSAQEKGFLSYFNNDLPDWKYFLREGIPQKFRFDCDFYDIAKYRSGNHTRVPIDSISSTCYQKNNVESRVVFIWGDSHAQQLSYGLSKELSKEYELLQVASSGCVANTKAKQSKTDYCDHSNWFAYDVIKNIKPQTVIVGQNLGHDFERMRELSSELKSAGVKRVIFTGPSPHWVPSLPAVLVRTLPNVPKHTFLGVDKAVLDLDGKLKRESEQSNFVEYVSLIDFFCKNDGCLTHYTEDVLASVTSWDYGHLAPIASHHLAKDLLAPFVAKKSEGR